MNSDIYIALKNEKSSIKDVAATLDIKEDDLETYGKYKAKLSFNLLKKLKNKKKGKLILVTATNPTPLGEGKTTVSIGLSDALCKMGKKSVLALREPSLGPCFGIKGGAAGGDVAATLDIKEDDLETYGKYKAKLSFNLLKKLKNKKKGKLILVTATNPTPLGEGKTTVSIGLSDALCKMGKKSVLALREPSLGPCFGIKGGAAGGGYSQVVPMDELNLHFTGDMHAITAANNLLSALIDNHIKQGNEKNLDLKNILWKRCMDMNDRVLRNIIVGLGKSSDGNVREDHFTITAASEIMAILCLSNNIDDLKNRIGNILIAYDMNKNPIFAKDIKAVGSVASLLKDAIKPNLIQTLEHNPAIIHGGPFANIAHGCNSLIGTKAALSLGDFCVTEAGFGADLGAEKFIDIKCKYLGSFPDVCVIVSTVRSLKYNGGKSENNIIEEDVNAVQAGLCNLKKHIENMKQFNIPIVVTLNKFSTDTENEIAIVKKACEEENVAFSLCEVWEKGSKGGIELAKEVLSAIDKENKEKNFSKSKFLYEDSISIKEKIEKIAKYIYGAKSVSYSNDAINSIKKLEKYGLDKKPVCIAKTQYSLSDDAKKLGRPKDFILNVRDIYVNNGAGFIVVLTGNVMTMPGLPKNPAAYQIDIDNDGNITGLF